MKITILWSSLASYSVAFFRELAMQGCYIQLVYQPINKHAPYQSFDLSFCEVALEDSEHIRKNLELLVNNFNPACILMSSWAFPHFMKVTRKSRKKGIYVVAAMDNQWRGSLKQYLGVLSSRYFLKPSIDTLFVPGERQAYFARKLGYENLLYGLYVADINRFSCAMPIWQRPKNFLFVGRLISIKGVQELTRAYLAYREQAADPWGLIVAGVGPLGNLLSDIPGVEMLGFVQPEILPRLMREARCFILPSRWEPWGVVIHEAAAAGLPIIATYSCGATTMYVRDGGNGYIVSTQSESIKRAMVRISKESQDLLERMSVTSSSLAETWNPVRLSKYFIDSIRNNIG